MTLREYIRIARSLNFRLRTAAFLLALHLASTVFEGLGIGMLLPVFQFIQAHGDLAALSANSRLWRTLVSLYGAVGIPVSLFTMLATSFLCILCRQAVVYVRLVYTSRMRERLIRDTRNLGFKRFLEADIAYQDSQPVGGMVNGLTTELVIAVDACLAPIQVMGYGFIASCYAVVLFLVSGPVTMAALVAITLSGLALKSLLGKTHYSGVELKQANNDMSVFLVERLKSARLVRLSGTEQAEFEDMTRLTQRQCDNMVKMRTLMARGDVLMEPLVVGVSFGLLYAGVAVFGLKIEEIGLFLVIVLRLLPVIKEALRTVQSLIGFQSSLTALDHRYRMMETARENRGGQQSFAQLTKEIRFENVTFRYQAGGNIPALQGINLVIPAARMTALVGPSGSGKSTLIDLLPRLREPTEGMVLFDGCPITHFALAGLRSGIAYVPQSPQLFNVTVARHIRYGKPDATEAEIREAARLADAAYFIEALPKGYETMLGEGGIRLSGGQRQRLDLARALVRKAPILILDEPTSHLDADAEEQLRAALRHIRHETKITLIIVGHSLGSVADADAIVVLNQGRLENIGTHDELMARGGWYVQAFTKQQRDGRGKAPAALPLGSPAS